MRVMSALLDNNYRSCDRQQSVVSAICCALSASIRYHHCATLYVIGTTTIIRGTYLFLSFYLKVSRYTECAVVKSSTLSLCAAASLLANTHNACRYFLLYGIPLTVVRLL